MKERDGVGFSEGKEEEAERNIEVFDRGKFWMVKACGFDLDMAAQVELAMLEENPHLWISL